MTTIKEDYVSFETAKLLKEKGFQAKCTACYRSDLNNTFELISGRINYCNPRFSKYKMIPPYNAPTLQMAMKWLREVHKISVEITSTGYLIDNDVEWECDIKAGHRLYFKHITNEKSFESCAEAALKYCLENLI